MGTIASASSSCRWGRELPPDGGAVSFRPTRPQLLLGGVVAVALLAFVETTVALVAPALAPTDADWAAAGRAVRTGFRPGDLIVAAPAWADPIMRVQLGDLIPPEVAGRMDDDRFARVWEVSQRGARAPATAGGTATSDERLGRLRVRLVEKPAEVVTYDFVARWSDARVSLRNSGGVVIPCTLAGDRIACPPPGGVSLRHQLVEVDQHLREALLTEPVARAAVVIEFPAVPLGRALVIATGLHDTWMRKAARGTVAARVTVGDQATTLPITDDDSGWTRTRIDTAARAGQTAPVRLEITSANPYDRFFAFAAEARR
jgi:hypothetical protein